MPEGKALHILVAGINWPPETFLERLVNGLLQRGVRITVATAERPFAAWLSRPGFCWLPTPAWQGWLIGRLARLLWLLLRGLSVAPARTLRVLRLGRQEGVGPTLRSWNRLLPFTLGGWDIIYFPWNSAAVECEAVFALETPVVISCRGSQVNIAPHNPQRHAFTKGLQRTLSRAAAVHCVSDAIKEWAVALGATAERCRVIRPAVDADFFCQPGRTSGKNSEILQIVTTGSLIWVKGLGYALSAIRLLKDRGVPLRFDIIGDGLERQRVLYNIHDLGLNNQVSLLGKLPPGAVRERLHAADVFLLPSLSEGISNAVLEAMACGLPVVTTDCGGMREALEDGREGYVVPTRNVAAMADALIKLSLDKNVRAEMGERARTRVLNEFSLQEQVKAFEALFRQACS